MFIILAVLKLQVCESCTLTVLVGCGLWSVSVCVSSVFVLFCSVLVCFAFDSPHFFLCCLLAGCCSGLDVVL